VTRLLGDDFRALVRDFEHTAFRLETLSRYSFPYEAEPLRRFLAGEPQDLGWMASWREFVTASRTAGKQVGRVHIVSEPLSDYLRFELTCAYPYTSSAGEEIGILPVPRGTWPADLPRHDFWLLDSCRLAVLHYEDDGRFLGAELVSDPAVIVQHSYWRDVARHRALPYDSYLGQRRELAALQVAS
jgi:hypothetical protein